MTGASDGTEDDNPFWAPGLAPILFLLFLF
jgi:hypothetical protein